MIKYLKNPITIALYLCLIVFIIDINTPLCFEPWGLFAIPIFVLYKSNSIKFVYYLLALISVLIFLGFMFSKQTPCNLGIIAVYHAVQITLVLGMFSIIITKLINLNREGKRAYDELRNVNKELESFSYSAAHDLKGPLRTMKMFGKILQEECTVMDKQEIVDYTNRISKGVDKMVSLIDDLMKLSKISSLELNPEIIDISKMVASLVEELRLECPESRVFVEIESGLKIKADAHLLRLALINLIENACKYTQRKPQAVIKFGEYKTNKRNGFKTFFIKDNGSGFDMKRGNPFEPFKRLHSESEFPGTGIGLSIVQRIIHKHNGNIWAESTVGKGSTFYFSLPSY